VNFYIGIQKRRQKKALSVIKFVDNFNNISRWISNYILTGNTAKQRAYFIMHVIDILSLIFKMDNFHGSVSLLASLESSAISRLKRSWEFVEKEKKEILTEIKSQFSTGGNWKIYRELLQQTTVPVIPYIGIALTDITFIDDGNGDLLGPDNLLINWKKCTLFYRVLSDLRRLQHGEYPFRIVPEIQEHIQKIIDTDEKQLHQRSLLIEPRKK